MARGSVEIDLVGEEETAGGRSQWWEVGGG
jgi:hypothetical protein